MKILLIEDNPTVGTFLSQALTRQRYTVDLATTERVGLDLAIAEHYELILLSTTVANLDSIRFCTQLRAQGCQTLIFLLVERQTAANIVAILDAGADDYMTQPYELTTLLARLRARMRRKEETFSTPMLVWGELCLNPNSAEVTYAGNPIILTPKAYSLLALFLQNPQRVFNRSAIIDRLWSLDELPTESAVTNQIKGLRQQLKAGGMSEDLIETVYGLGYRLKAHSGDRAPDPCPLPTSANPDLGAAQPGRTILVVDGDQALTEQLQQDALLWGVQVKVATTLAQARVAIADTPPDLLLLDLNLTAPGDRPEDTGLTLLREVTTTTPIPVLVFSDRDTLSDRVLVSRLGAKGFLHKPLTSVDVFSPVLQLLSQPQVAPNTILIVTTNTTQGQIIRDLIEPWGVQVKLLANAQDFWSHLPAIAPNLLVLDWDLPTFGGADLCRVVRQDARWGNLPILMLTHTPEAQHIRQIFAIGADDFISQPFIGPEVVTRIISRLEQVPLASHLEHTLNQNYLTFPYSSHQHSDHADILLVDDQPDNLRTLTKILSGHNYKIRKATSGEMALKAVHSACPDVILLDVRMPEMDGYAVCSALKATAPTRDIPVIFLSALDDVADKVKAFTVGGADYVTKPFQAEEVIARIKYQLTMQQQQRQLRERNYQLQQEIFERLQMESRVRECNLSQMGQSPR